tara:strand:- start:1020 stop:1349 length:330 start_codon:yes stop_codon:yes gene_type:complete
MTSKVEFSYEEPVFVISVAAKVLGLRTQTLRYYESLGLLSPGRTEGNQRVYSNSDIDRVRRIRNLTDDLGLNLAGAEVVMKLLEKIEDLENQLNKTLQENLRLKDLLSS